ncbi:zinc finger protein 771 isoform X1 [Echinops telfairi]|uniref:Zinc finger protein 771 isoform X1 n=1 Tax=Echinops telfairi TaxID=9371 RepID=A0AC55CRP3_ECHTE|nr:zinc finger protein 771 isoform X1 [Echinops telfairi]
MPGEQQAEEEEEEEMQEEMVLLVKGEEEEGEEKYEVVKLKIPMDNKEGRIHVFVSQSHMADSNSSSACRTLTVLGFRCPCPAGGNCRRKEILGHLPYN